MALFTSKREKQLWLLAFLVFAAIYSTLFIGNPLAKFFADQNTQVIIFLIGMLLTAIAILLFVFKFKPNRVELSLIVGIIAVYSMLTMRLGLAERSHLIEYSVLAIAIHSAILERRRGGKNITWPALISLSLTIGIGIVDECLQLFIPHRVFDSIDILFNSIAAFGTIAPYVLISWLQKKFFNS